MANSMSEETTLIVNGRSLVQITPKMKDSELFKDVTKTRWKLLEILTKLVSNYSQHVDTYNTKLFLKDLSKQVVKANVGWGYILHLLNNPIQGLRELFDTNDFPLGIYHLLVLSVFSLIHSPGVRTQRHSVSKMFFYHFKIEFSNIVGVLTTRSNKEFGHPHGVTFSANSIFDKYTRKHTTSKNVSVCSLINLYMRDLTQERNIQIESNDLTTVTVLNRLVSSFLPISDQVMFSSYLVGKMSLQEPLIPMDDVLHQIEPDRQLTFDDMIGMDGPIDLSDLVVKYSMGGCVDTLHRIIGVLDTSVLCHQTTPCSKSKLATTIWGEDDPLLIELREMVYHLSNYSSIVLILFVYMLMMLVNRKSILKYVSSERSAFIDISISIGGSDKDRVFVSEDEAVHQFKSNINGMNPLFVRNGMNPLFVKNSVVCKLLDEYLKATDGKRSMILTF